MTSTYDLSRLFSVKGKRVLITGGGSGLGQNLAEGLANNGARVYVVGRRKDKLEETVAKGPKGSIIALPGDVSTKDGIAQIVKDFEKTGEKQLDVLVNGAGILKKQELHPQDPDKLAAELWAGEWSDWADSMDVNVASVYFMSVAFIPFLRRDGYPSDKSESPSIINIASIAGLHHERSNPSSYQVSKAAAAKLTTILSAKLIPFNVRVNALLPGIFPSEMTAGSAMLGDAMARTIPTRRVGSAEDIIGTTIWLASRAGAYLNGANIVIDGGRFLTTSAKLGGEI